MEETGDSHRCSKDPLCHRIVLSGGPGGGKTTAGDILRREFGKRVAYVPEAATLLFAGGFPRYEEAGAVEACQRAIYHTQRGLEDAQLCHFEGRVLLCDRGTVDGAGYWPAGEQDYFATLGTTLHDELRRYDAVIFFESAAVSELAINGSMLEGGNAYRREGLTEAKALDSKLRALWSQHPNFHLVKSSDSFFAKLHTSVQLFGELVTELDTRTPAIRSKWEGSSVTLDAASSS